MRELKIFPEGGGPEVGGLRFSRKPDFGGPKIYAQYSRLNRLALGLRRTKFFPEGSDFSGRPEVGELKIFRRSEGSDFFGGPEVGEPKKYPSMVVDASAIHGS